MSLASIREDFIIQHTAEKALDWYLEGYDDELDRYDWGASEEPKGREKL